MTNCTLRRPRRSSPPARHRDPRGASRRRSLSGLGRDGGRSPSSPRASSSRGVSRGGSRARVPRPDLGRPARIRSRERGGTGRSRGRARSPRPSPLARRRPSPGPVRGVQRVRGDRDQLMYLLDRPPKHRRREMVEEWSPTANANVTVPYPRSERFVRDALRRVCSRESLARFQRKETWLGETTWLPDDLPWDPARELARPIDEDLRRICRRALKVGEDALLASVARRDPSAACRDLGCGDAPGALEALAEASWRLATDPWTLLKLAPVLLTAFAAPALLLPTFRPPTDQGDISKAVEKVRAAREGARRGERGRRPPARGGRDGEAKAWGGRAKGSRSGGDDDQERRGEESRLCITRKVYEHQRCRDPTINSSRFGHLTGCSTPRAVRLVPPPDRRCDSRVPSGLGAPPAVVARHSRRRAPGIRRRRRPRA